MKCPSCDAAVDFRRETCAACGTAYLDALEKKAAASIPQRERRHGDRRQVRTERARTWAAGLAAAVAAVCLAGVLVARGPARQGLPAGALRHEGGGFAFVPPAGWSLSTDASGVRLWRGPAAVRVWRSAAPQPEEAGELARSAFNGATVRVLSSSAADLDGASALRVEVAGERVVMPSADAGRQLSPLHAPAPAQESGELRGLVLAAPRGGGALLVLAFSEEGDYARRHPEIEAFLSSLRRTR